MGLGISDVTCVASPNHPLPTSAITSSSFFMLVGLLRTMHLIFQSQSNNIYIAQVDCNLCRKLAWSIGLKMIKIVSQIPNLIICILICRISGFHQLSRLLSVADFSKFVFIIPTIIFIIISIIRSLDTTIDWGCCLCWGGT